MCAFFSKKQDENVSKPPVLAQIEIYTKPWCGYCHRAKTLLDKKGAKFKEINIANDAQLRQEMMDRSGGYTVPQIFINGKPIGGCDSLMALERDCRLDDLLGQSPP